jgi:hypothetical protein
MERAITDIAESQQARWHRRLAVVLSSTALPLAGLLALGPFRLMGAAAQTAAVVALTLPAVVVSAATASWRFSPLFWGPRWARGRWSEMRRLHAGLTALGLSIATWVLSAFVRIDDGARALAGPYLVLPAVAGVALAAAARGARRERTVLAFVGACATLAPAILSKVNGLPPPLGVFPAPPLRNERLAGLDLRHLHAPSGHTLDLSGADLSRVDLRHARLDGGNLSDAGLAGAALDGASLRRTTLDGVCFYGSSLRGTDFAAAELTGADFSGADPTVATGLTEPQLELARGDDDTVPLRHGFSLACASCGPTGGGRVYPAPNRRVCRERCPGPCCAARWGLPCR